MGHVVSLRACCADCLKPCLVCTSCGRLHCRACSPAGPDPDHCWACGPEPRIATTNFEIRGCPYCRRDHAMNGLTVRLGEDAQLQMMSSTCPVTGGEFVVGPAIEAQRREGPVEDPDFQWNVTDYYRPDETDWENRAWWGEPWPGTKKDALFMLDALTHVEQPHPAPYEAQLVRLLVESRPALAEVFRRIRHFVAQAACDLCDEEGCSGC